MQKILLLLILSFFSVQSFAGSCPDGSEPVRSISDDGTYFVFNCGGSAVTSSNTFEMQNTDKYCPSVILPNDVAFGDKYNVCLLDKTAFKEYGLQVVDKKDGHPVRAGSKSMRFELRDGDCNDPPPPAWNDCKNDRERFELSGKEMFNGEEGWYAWSIFIPKDYIDTETGANDLGQFNLEPGQDPDPCCVFMISKKKSGYKLELYIWKSNKWTFKSIALNLSDEEMSGNWSDFIINFKWSKKDDGFIKLWLNNELVYEHSGQTFSKDTEFTYFKFGIYRSALSRYLNHKNFSPEVEACFEKNGASAEVINLTKKGEDSQVLGWGANAISLKIFNQCKHLYKIKVPTQIVYYDEVRVGKSKEEVVGSLPLRINNSKETEPEVNSSKTKTNVVATKEEERRIPADLELPIFDDVEYKLEGQILKVNIFNPKMKPLTRHMGSLWTKCGSGLIDQLGWLSFVSIDSNSKNQQCHYDYYKSSNDNEAFELFKAVLSGTDSVLDYLQK